MTVKMMTGKQVNFLKKLVEQKAVPKEEWEEIIAELELDVSKEDDLYHLNVEEASHLISALVKMPDK